MRDVPRLGSGIPLVARGREMDRLRAAFERAASGSAAAVLVAGDAGVGKTRLTEELAAMARDKGALVLAGRCLDAGETGLPYLPFAEALTQAREAVPADVLARPALARLLPENAVPAIADPGRLAPELPAVARGAGGRGASRPDQDVGQLQLFDAVYGLLSDLAEQATVVLILEDLHWADGSTRGLLSFLLARLRSQRLLIVGTYRSDDLHRRHPLRPLLAELVRLPAVERLELAPFGVADARAFVGALAEDLLPDEVVREVAGRSEGNAFFAEELLAAYTDYGGGGIPATLVDVLLARVERLSPAAQQVVRVASVAGREVPHARLRAVIGLSELGTGELEEALREAIQHHILVVVGDWEVYSFRHALLREAAYSDLLPGERVRLHAAYAKQFAAEQGTRGAAAALAHHSMESHAMAQALAASVAAAEEAERLGAPAESLKHIERALRLWDAVPEADRPSDVDELTLLRRALWVAGTSGEPERAIAYARSAVKLADQRDDPELQARLRRRLAQALYIFDGREAEAREVIEQAWELVAARPPSEVRAWVLAVYATILRGAGMREAARERAEMAVRDARAASDGTEVMAAGAEADALTTLAVLDEGEGRVEESVERLHEARQKAVEAGALQVELRAWYMLVINRYEQGHLDEAARVLDAGVERARKTGMTWSTYGTELRIFQVVLRYVSGDWDGAEAAAEPPGHRVSGTVSARLAAVGAPLIVARGRFAEAERLVGDLRAERHRDVQIAMVVGAAGADLACWRGRPERAVEWVREGLESVLQVWGPWQLAGIKLAALGVAAHADIAARAAVRRDTEAVQVAVEQGVQLAEHARKTASLGVPRTGTLGPEGRAWLARAEAEASRLRGNSDPELWQAAVDGFDWGAVYEQAICRWRLAEALLGVDRRDEAADELRLVDQVAERLGARPLRDAVRRLAKRGRITLGDAAVARDTVDPFTPRERAVLRLVALGRTNRQIGDELFISEKTVSVHLSRIMAKLGATRRAEAVAIAIDRGLLGDGPTGGSQ
ncbi:MAG TPA: AAA family ATPase [Actinophytocola sp.]|uniref:helix-turn-helix transcriptional regulator n=1 Tax=Actinophytocola sp. TaxID=1872138 RepID=UPI002DDD3399|nr:AAA family ATPase [Actinophytocola sp.]HEV2778581.1 AAA family ATPase [Actinophytocola sp.]